MKSWLTVAVAVVAIAFAGVACGGGDDADGDDQGSSGGGAENGTATAAPRGSSGGGGSSSGSGGSGGDAPAMPTPIGPVAVNTIQLGDETWTRTLPMTTGQCFLYEDDGTLPTSAVSWGPLDGDDGIRFSANQNQDGTFESEVRDDDGSMYWIAGPRSPGVDDLEIELDFDTLTITGEGTYSNPLGEVRAGSFQIQCEPEDQ